MPLSSLNSSRDYLRVLFSWKHHAILIFISILVIMMGFAYLYTPLYEASARIAILPRTDGGVVISSGLEESKVAAVSQQDVNTEIELICSLAVLHNTISSLMSEGRPPGLRKPSISMLDKASDFVKETIQETLIFLRLKHRLTPFESMVALLARSIEVEPIAMSNIILVTLKAEQPKAAAIVLDRLLEVYIQHHGQVYTKDEGINFYSDQAEKYRTKLADAEERVKEFKNDNHIVDLEKQNFANIDQLSKFTVDLLNINVTINECQSKINLLKSGFKNGITATREMKRIPAIAEFDKALVPLYIQRGEILKNYTKESREYLGLEEQINALKMEIRNEVQKAVQTEELELVVLLDKRDSINKGIEDLQRASDEINQKQKHLNEMQREVHLYGQNFMLYASKKEDAIISSDIKNRNLANISIADRPKVPSVPSFPNRILFLVLSIVAGISAALGSPFLLEFIDHRIKTPHDVERYLNLPVICSITDESDKMKS